MIFLSFFLYFDRSVIKMEVIKRNLETFTRFSEAACSGVSKFAKKEKKIG
jgi:hypothetical protein